jgi:hypothetical protein
MKSRTTTRQKILRKVLAEDVNVDAMLTYPVKDCPIVVSRSHKLLKVVTSFRSVLSIKLDRERTDGGFKYALSCHVDCSDRCTRSFDERVKSLQ